MTQAENEAKNAASLANKASEVSLVSSIGDRRKLIQGHSGRE